MRNIHGRVPMESVSTTRRVHARVRTLRDGVCTLFWLTKSCLSVTLNIWHLVCDNFPQVHSKQSSTSRLFFNLWTLLTMQLLTYKDVSVCKLSHTRTCLFATCHKISIFYLDHHCVDYETCSCACSRTKKTNVCALFELERHVYA